LGSVNAEAVTIGRLFFAVRGALVSESQTKSDRH
jgi:hypothetical protein